MANLPEIVPNSLEITGLLCSAGLLAASVAASATKRRSASFALGSAAIALGVAVLIGHSMARGDWLPLDDNFDALGFLGILLAAAVLYIQFARPVGGLDWFVLPISAFMLIEAAIFGRTVPHQYAETAWSWTHRLTAYTGALALAVAGAVGAMYLVALRRLRSKNLNASTSLGSLERLESIAQYSLAIGWPLFTVGLITGLLWGIHRQAILGNSQPVFFAPKILLAVGVWIAFALALHTPINPSFRGRKAAALSLVGLLLVAATLIVVQFMPEASH